MMSRRGLFGMIAGAASAAVGIKPEPASGGLIIADALEHIGRIMPDARQYPAGQQ